MKHLNALFGSDSMLNLCRAEFDKLPESARHNRIDHYQDANTIYRLIQTARLAIDLHREGEDELKPSVLRKVEAFVARWQDSAKAA